MNAKARSVRFHILTKDGPAARRLADDLERDFGPLDREDKEKLLRAFVKVGAFLRGGATFRSAFYYIADFTAQDPLQIRFLDFLAHSGYIVRKKAVKVLEDKETGAKTYKANVDTEMVLDMVNTADNYDVAFLLSGDSDFERCVDLLRSRGKRVYIMTSEKAVSRELSHVADKPIFFIEDYQDLLARTDKGAT